MQDINSSFQSDKKDYKLVFVALFPDLSSGPGTFDAGQPELGPGHLDH